MNEEMSYGPTANEARTNSQLRAEIATLKRQNAQLRADLQQVAGGKSLVASLAGALWVRGSVVHPDSAKWMPMQILLSSIQAVGVDPNGDLVINGQVVRHCDYQYGASGEPSRIPFEVFAEAVEAATATPEEE